MRERGAACQRYRVDKEKVRVIRLENDAGRVADGYRIEVLVATDVPDALGELLMLVDDAPRR